jgi:tetratricopeptide (TPR) repeat protein
MTVHVPFRLRRRPRGERAVAVFVPGRDPAPLLSVCAQVRQNPTGRVHDVNGGFVLKLDAESTEPIPGAIRLRALAPDFLLPVDADLIPALLDDEAAGLVRDGGLVFLPGGRMLRFNQRVTVELAALVTIVPRPRRVWTALPRPRTLPERITEITIERPELSPEALYQGLGQDLRPPGPHSARSRRGGKERGQDRSATGPADAEGGDPSSRLGSDEGAGEGAWHGIHGLGGVLDSLRGLLDQAGESVSALREKLQWEWLDHSALVNKLLREFREGDPSRALRHAFSMEPADPRQPVVGWGNRLPWSRAIYDLAELLGGPKRGQPVGVWRARPDLMKQLSREYRKAAEAAQAHGDFRRAAYIYGKLLGDHAMAARSLQLGGLYADAAILYLKKLNQLAAAAASFEAAGMVERALALYRQIAQYESAGDLLRRIGDEEEAAAEYSRAAEMLLLGSPPDYLAAGNLLDRKARRPDLATALYEKGWDRRPQVNAVLCGVELVSRHADRGDVRPLGTLLDQAEKCFQSAGSDREVALFYGAMTAAAARLPAAGSFSDEIRDRVLLSLAGRLRRTVESGRPGTPAVSTLFSSAHDKAAWPPALVSDAEFAASAVRRKRRDRSSPAAEAPRVEGIQVGRRTVTAAGQAAATAEVFLGFDTGIVVAYHPDRNHIVSVGAGPFAVTSLAVDPAGHTVVALHQSENVATLSTFVRRPDGTFVAHPHCHIATRSASWLTPILTAGSERLVGLADEHSLLVLEAYSGRHWAFLSTADLAVDSARAAFLLPSPEPGGREPVQFVALLNDGPRWFILDLRGRRRSRCHSYWCPAGVATSPLRHVPLCWRHVPPFVEVVGLDPEGAVHATRFRVHDNLILEVLLSRGASTEGGYLAATWSGPDRVVAISPTRIEWLSLGSERFQPVRELSVNLPMTVAAFPSPSNQEILVVRSDGFIARINVPWRARGGSWKG